jgi:hypothetical protein
MDDFLLKGAGIATCFVALAGLVVLAVPEEAGALRTGLALALGFAALAPIAMLALGLHLRKREQRAQALVALLDRQGELAAADLLRNSDFDALTLERAVRDLNSSGVRHVVWDRERGLLQDGRLRQARLHIETCPACGVKITLDVPLHRASAAVCPSCGSAIDAREVDEEKQAVMDALRDEAAPKPSAPRRSFSLPLFLLLLVACWPLALVYGAVCWRPAEC